MPTAREEFEAFKKNKRKEQKTVSDRDKFEQFKASKKKTKDLPKEGITIGEIGPEIKPSPFPPFQPERTVGEFDPKLALKNFPRSAKDVGQSFLQAGKVALGGVEKLMPGLDQFEPQFDAAVGAVKEDPGGFVKGIGKTIFDKIRSRENFAREIEEDPANLLMDAGTGLSLLGGVAKTGATQAAKFLPKGGKVAGALEAVKRGGQLATTTANIVDPITGIPAGIGAMAKRPKINSIAKTALQLPHKMKLEQIDSLADSFVKRGLNINRRSLKILAADKQKVLNSINDIIDTKIGDKVRIKTRDLTDSFDTLIANARREGFGFDDLKAIKKERNDLFKQHGALLTAKEVQELKQGYGKAFQVGENVKFGAVREKMREKLRIAAKLQLEELSPDLKGLNAEWSEMKALGDAIDLSVKHFESTQTIGSKGLVVGGFAGGVTGAATGNLSAGLASGLLFGVSALTIEKIISNIQVQVALARAINRNNIRLAKLGKLSKGVRPAFQAGRESKKQFEQSLSEQAKQTIGGVQQFKEPQDNRLISALATLNAGARGGR